MTDVSKLEGFELDMAVYRAQIETAACELHIPFSTKWEHGGPIIEREQINLSWMGDEWQAWIEVDDKLMLPDNTSCGPTPLIAAMRCYVASKQ